MSIPKAPPETFVTQIKLAAAQDLKCCKYQATEVSIALSGLSGRDITTQQLEGFVDAATPHRFPLDLLPAWVRVTGSRRILDLLLERI
jgi:hypothetical protein